MPIVQVHSFKFGRERMRVYADDIAQAMQIVEVELDQHPAASIYVTCGELADDESAFMPYTDSPVLQVRRAQGASQVVAA